MHIEVPTDDYDWGDGEGVLGVKLKPALRRAGSELKSRLLVDGFGFRDVPYFDGL